MIMDVLEGDLLDYLYIIKSLITNVDRRKQSILKQGEGNAALQHLKKNIKAMILYFIL